MPRPYAHRMANVIANLSAGVSGASAPPLLAGTGSQQRQLIVVATSDRGLAGGFNSGIVRAAREKIAGLIAEGKDVKIITVGRKGRDQLRRAYGARFVETYEIGTKPAGFGLVKPIASNILDLYMGGQFDVVTLIYSHFKSVVTQTPTVQQIQSPPPADFASPMRNRACSTIANPDERRHHPAGALLPTEYLGADY